MHTCVFLLEFIVAITALVDCYRILSYLGFSFQVFPQSLLGRGLHTLTKNECFVLLSIQCRISQCYDTICNGSSSPLVDIVYLGFPFQTYLRYYPLWTSPYKLLLEVFKTRLLVREYSILSFRSPLQPWFPYPCFGLLPNQCGISQ